MQGLIEKEISITLLGKTVKIKPLTLKQTICLGTLLGAHYEAAVKDQNFLLSFIKNAGEGQADEIINILCNFSFTGYKDISANVSLAEISALFKALGEVNDFEAVAANFKYALAKMVI